MWSTKTMFKLQVELDYRRATLQNHETVRVGDKTSPPSDTFHKLAGDIQSSTRIAEKRRTDLSTQSMPLSDIDFQVARARGQISRKSDYRGKASSTTAHQNTNPVTKANNYTDIDFGELKAVGESNIKSHAQQQNSATTTKYAAINFKTSKSEEQQK